MDRHGIEQGLERIRIDGRRLKDPRVDVEEATPTFAEGLGEERAPA